MVYIIEEENAAMHIMAKSHYEHFFGLLERVDLFRPRADDLTTVFQCYLPQRLLKFPKSLC